MNDKELLDCLHENEIKRLKGEIELLNEKVLDYSIRLATYCADYEGKIAELQGQRIHNELDYYKHVCNELYEQNKALTKSIGKISKDIKSSVRLLESAQTKYKEFLDSSKLGPPHPPFLLDATQAIDFLNILDAKLTDSANPHINKELEKRLKANADSIETKGFRRLIIKSRYNAEPLLKELHKLIDGKLPREHVPYILILLEKKAIERPPTWNEMREEFKDIGKSKSNYYKFLKYELNSVSEKDFPNKEIASKRTCIKDILKKCQNKLFTVPQY